MKNKYLSLINFKTSLTELNVLFFSSTAHVKTPAIAIAGAPLTLFLKKMSLITSKILYYKQIINKKVFCYIHLIYSSPPVLKCQNLYKKYFVWEF